MSEQKLDIDTIVAGLLHDILEDTLYNKDLLKEDFGEIIQRLVLGVTKMGTVRYQGVERHAESLRKFIISMSEDIRVVVIKLCDRLHNMQTLKYVKPEKRHRIASETVEIYARLADRLGMGKLKSELEDLAFPFIDEKEYKKTMDILSDIQSVDDETLKKISNNLKEELSVFDVEIESVDYRVKRLYSL
ncbi:MAG: HD domain-containing protein [Cyanobium sp. MAG06]|nr:HD domain-containing protein [Cyanobium sp. MAG06]